MRLPIRHARCSCRAKSSSAPARGSARHDPPGMNKVLDAEVLDMLVEAIGDEGVRGVIALFLDECRELTAAMAAPGADRAAVLHAAHSLKSSAGQLGALALSEAALAVETAAAAG